MKTIFRTLLPSESRPPGISGRMLRRSRFQSLSHAFVTALMTAAAAGLASAQSLQPAGDVILNLRSIDLDPANTIWTNQTINAFSVGDLHTLGGGVANVQSLAYADAIVGNTNVNALFVNASGNNSMVSSSQVPAEILGHGAVSAEVWIQATDVGSLSATITSATVAYGNVNNDPKGDHQRDFNYSIGNGNGAVSGFGDDADWTPKTFPTPGVWHYLTFTYDGTTFLAYQDGVLNTTASKPNWNTLSGVMCVGSDGATGGGDPFHGYIAAARVMSGVLTANQISNNFNAGLFGAYGVIALTPTVVPSASVFLGDTVTLSEVVQSSSAVTYQWQTDNGSGGATFTPIAGATGSNYVLHTAGLTAQNYEYEVVVTGNNSASSPPLTIKVNPVSGPTLTQDITPATTANIFVGASVTFNAAFTGNQTITNQWQVSKDNGATFQNLAGDTNATLTLANLQVTDSGKYRLVATNAFGHGQSSAATLTVQPTSALPQLQVAGQLLVNLEPSALNGSSAVWTNAINGIGDFTVISNGVLPVTNLTYNSQSINVLAVNHNPGNAVASTQQAPLGITGNGPVSVEAWVFPTGVSGNNSDVSYGVQGGSGAPEQQREFNYNTGNNGALSGDFGNLDAGWNGSVTANAWHYLAYVYDGTNFQCYMDGVLDLTKTGANPLPTVQTVITVGANIAGSDPGASGGYSDSFQGYIANVRIATGVLSAGQVANNFISGPLKTIPVVLSTPVFSPSNSVFYGDSVTVSVANAQSLQSLTFQWQTDNGTAGATWSNIAGATDTNYSFSTTSLPRPTVPVNYEYQLVATGGGTVATSAPVTLTIRPAAPPTVITDTTATSSALFVGQQVTFTAAFTGNQPITNQWQVSTNGGVTFNNVAGATGNSYTLASVQLTDSGEYRLAGTNAFGGTNSTPASLLVLPTSAYPAVQVAGSLIVDLKPSGLDTNAGLWHNLSADPNSVGDFTYTGTAGPLSVAALTFNSQPINVLNVAGNGDNSVEALNVKAPAILLGANPCSMEAWIFATAVGGNNTVVNYGDQTSQSGNLDRALNYQNQPYGAFTGYFGNADVQWLPAQSGATANVWHYIAVTYDGSNLKLYQDGHLNNSLTGITLLTDDTYISVGSGTGNAIFAGAAPFSGYIAAARVETGVLTDSQISQNYTAGPAPGLTVGLNIQQLAPLTSHFTGGTLTLTWASGTLQEATSANGPWITATGVASPLTVTPATAGAPAKFYRLKY